MKRASGGTQGGVDVQWILDVAQMDLSVASPSMLRRLARRAVAEASGREGVRSVEYGAADSAMLLEVEGGSNTFPEATRSWLKARQREVSGCLEALLAGRGWQLPEAARVVGVMPIRNGLVPRYSGSPRALLYSRVVDVLRERLSDIRRCVGCGLLFVPHDGRQRFHSLRCGQATRWAKYSPRRKRDYSAEYRARVKKQTGQTKIRRRR